MTAFSDRLATQLQETGRGYTLGLTLAQVVEVVDALGLKADEVVMTAGPAVVVLRVPVAPE